MKRQSLLPTSPTYNHRIQTSNTPLRRKVMACTLYGSGRGGGGLSADKKNGRSHANIQTKQQLRSNAPITVKVRGGGGGAVHRMGIWTIALAWGRAFESSCCSGRRDILNFRSRLWPQIISWVGEFQLYLTSHFCLGVRNLTAIFGKMSKSHPDRQDMFIWSLVQ